MYIVLCVDDHNGLSFNRRRQSRDRRLIDDLLSLTSGHRLLCAPYSLPLFPEGSVSASHDFLLRAKADDYCFTELHPLPDLELIQGLVLYRWNRDYPADCHLTLELSRFTLASTTEFPGSSHEKITREVYLR